MYNLFYLFLLFFTLSAQLDLNWKVLEEAKFQYGKRSGKGSFDWDVSFSKTIKSIENKDVSIVGYIIPINYKKNTYALSKNSFANCFFCGVGGMETIIELEFTDKSVKYKLDTFSVIRGTFKLNSKDKTKLAFIIKNATEADL